MNDTIGEDSNAVNTTITAATLSAIAYCPTQASIISSLANSLPGWSLAWIPDVEINGNYAFIAFNQAAQQYAVAIRGSVLEFSWQAFEDWFEQDFNVLRQSDWTYPATNSDPKISRGAADGLSDLTSLVSTASGPQVRMLDFLLQTAVANNISIMITGHSLGGGLATVFAPWLYYQITSEKKPVPSMPVITFAAPAVGNQAFVTAYDQTFSTSWRYYNSQDIVPMASASITSMGDLYSSPEASSISTTFDGHTVTLQDAIIALDGLVVLSEIYYDSIYAQTNQASGSVKLNPTGKLFPVTATQPLEQWFEQAGAQHSISNAYLPFLGGQPFTCS